MPAQFSRSEFCGKAAVFEDFAVFILFYFTNLNSFKLTRLRKSFVRKLLQ